MFFPLDFRKNSGDALSLHIEIPVLSTTLGVLLLLIKN
jgi:hypothetical protein